MIRKKLLILSVILFIGHAVNAQLMVNGIVTEQEDQTAIPGVSVTIKGSQMGTITNQKGKYSIEVPTDSTVLIFHSVGFQRLEAPVNGKGELSIALEANYYDLNEVVVIGYGDVVKQNLTGSIGKIQGNKLQPTPESSLEGKLKGKLAGVYISSSTGKLGESINMKIRGAASISAGNQPLYVVDGIAIYNDDISTPSNQPLNLLSSLNTVDIESIEVLKDASAAAIYGARASNGVVLITTKKGKYNQKNSLNFGTSFSLQKETRRLNMMDAQEYLEFMGEAAENVGEDTINGYESGRDMIMDWYGYDTTITYDWQDEMFRPGSIYEAYINAKGGNENSNYYAGFNYLDQVGVLVGNEMKKYNGILKYNNRVNEYIDFGFNINLGHTQLNRVANDNAYSSPTQLIAQQPIIAPYLENGEPNPDTYYYNSLISVNNDFNQNKVFRSVAGFNLNAYIIPEKLKYTAVLSSDVVYQKETLRISSNSEGGGNAGYGDYRTVNNNNLSYEGFLTYSLIQDMHNLDVILGSSYQQSAYERGFVSGVIFPTDDILVLDAAAENDGFGTYNRKTTFQGVFSRAKYKLNGKYLLSASLRRDGSSRFGADNQWGNFYSISAGWLASNEIFMQNYTWLSFLKPRISYGTTGNANIPDFQYLNIATSNAYTVVPGLNFSQLGVSTLGWERTAQFDFGVDIGVLNNRVYAEIDFYNKQTEDLLLYLAIPSSNGLNGYYDNIGSIQNKGVEFLVKAKPLLGDLKWNIDFNIATNTNMVTELKEQIFYYYNAVEEGKPLGYFYMPEYAGVDPSNGDALYYDQNGEKTPYYDEEAFKMVGNPNPKYYGGFNNYFQYKDFDLNIFFQFVADVDVYKADAEFMSSNGTWDDNQTRDQLERWQNPGDQTNVPQARLYEYNGSYMSSRYLSDASYLRLKELSIGYNIPLEILNKYKIQNARLYVSGSNVLTFTKYTGYDPEVSSPGAGLGTTDFNLQQGIDYYSMPQSKSITFGLHISF